jgi:hypothetical protein
MAFRTVAGFNPLGGSAPAANANGLYPISGVVTGANWDKVHRDLVEGARQQSLSGVISGGVCTAALLVVTIPANTYYIAGGIVWYNTGAETAGVSDDTTTYLWGCSDGVIRPTATTTPPTDFTASTACIITKAVAVSGVATVDNSVQQRARTADSTNRVIGENAGVFAPVLDTIPSTFRGVIESGSQYNLFGSFTNSGSIVCRGKLRVEG